MREQTTTRIGVLVVLGCVGIMLPLFRGDGQAWVLAAVSALTVYTGARRTIMYGSLFFLFVIEVVYGGDVGVVSIAYVVATVFYLVMRRFIALTAWETLDGWRLGDAVRSVLMSWFVLSVGLSSASGIGSLLYGYGFVGERILYFWTFWQMFPLVLIIMLVIMLVRRASIPFRRAIQFGT